MVEQDSVFRTRRAARLAVEYALSDPGGTGRYAAVVHREGREQLVRGEEIDTLLVQGELVALVDLDYDGNHR